MSKRLILILALVFVVGIACAAYAEVQNVKVSGDLLLRAINRSNFTLDKSWKYKASGLTSQMRIRVDADLTDNVSTTIRLINESSWGQGLSLYSPAEMFGSSDDGFSSSEGQYVQGAASVWDHPIDVDLAYVTLKEFLYSPLTLTLGRQELRFGNALIIGNSGLGTGAFGVPFDLSLRKSFDAMRATLDYSPWVLDLVYAKINENDIWWLQSLASNYPEKNDADLMGINAAWDMKALGITGKTDLYFWSRVNKLYWSVGETDKKDVCNTVGALISGQIAKNLTGSFEMAWQFGRANMDLTDRNTGSDLKRQAMALQGMLNYTFETKDKTAPTLGIGYTYLSGDKKNDGTDKFWDPMYEDQIPNNITNALFPNSGVQCINLMGSIKPKEDITLALNWGYYTLTQKMNGAEIPSPYGDDAFGTISTTKRSLGNALDLTATYDYTEDVQFGLTAGIFKPGAALTKSYYKATASQLIGSMKVTF